MKDPTKMFELIGRTLKLQSHKKKKKQTTFTKKRHNDTRLKILAGFETTDLEYLKV